MGTLYDLSVRVTAQLEEAHAGDPIGLVRAKGELATRTGFLVSLIDPRDPDDPEKVVRLRQAAAAIGIYV
jgi:hypothetical protein